MRDGIDLRYMKLGGIEYVRRVYFAVRDPGWNTLRPEIQELEFEQHEDRFSMNYLAAFDSSDVGLEVRGRVTGSATEVSLSATATFTKESRFAKVGMCVH